MPIFVIPEGDLRPLTPLRPMPSRTAHLRRARHWIANRGWGGFARQMLWRTRLKLRGLPVPGRPGPERGPHPFDLAYNVDTAGLVWGEALTTTGAPHEQDAQYWATGYYGVSPSAFGDALRTLALDWPRFTFVDIGCGKGRALLLSLRYPFRSVIGVELSPELAAVAQQNLHTFRAPWKRSDVPAHISVGDATTFDLPHEPLLLYLYHPFAGPVMQRFLDHIGRSLQAHPRPLYLLYTNPELASMLARTPFLTEMWNMRFAMSNEDVAADRFDSHDEQMIAYRAHVTPV